MALDVGERKQREIIRANVRRGDVVVDLLNLPPDHKLAIAQALERLRMAGGSALDLPAAVDEFSERHLEARSTIGDVLNLYISDLESLGRSKETIRDRTWRLKRLLNHFGPSERISTVGRAELAAWLALSTPGSRRHDYTAAAAMFRWAWQRGYVAEYPLGALPKPAMQRRGEADILTPGQVSMLLYEAMKGDDALVRYIALGVFAGLRPTSELVRLEWKDIDLDEGRIYVVSGKTGRARPVPISKNLAAWLDLTPKSKQKGLVAQFSRRAWRRVQKAAGVHVGHDVLRHTRCSYRLAELKDPGIVAAEGGHTLAILQRHYANLRIKQAQVDEFWNIMPP